jgi:hypothetical protein
VACHRNWSIARLSQETARGDSIGFEGQWRYEVSASILAIRAVGSERRSPYLAWRDLPNLDENAGSTCGGRQAKSQVKSQVESSVKSQDSSPESTVESRGPEARQEVRQEARQEARSRSRSREGST